MVSDTVFRFQKNERLKKGDFRGAQWVKRSETALFSLLIRKNTYGSKRIAVAIRRQVGKAVIRNRMKRLIKECFRLRKELFADGCDNLVKVKRVPQRPDFEAVCKEISALSHTGNAPGNRTITS
ncbi:MAG TPA: ribonuclease P protein component [Syntrophorhabdaceae bacterium]|nr:ribonuclease P protein component [Syntrophorhabdaceae bacterium]